MPSGRFMILLVLGYAGLCLIFLSLLALLSALLYWLHQSMDLAPALLVTGVVGLVPILIGLLVALSRVRSEPQPVKLDLQSIISELGIRMGREAGEFAQEKPWQTVLIATVVGFIASSHPKLVEQILKGLKLSL